MKALKQMQRFLLLLTLVLVAACTEIDICTEEYHPHFAHMNFEFDWSEFEGKQPDSIYIIAYRVINMWKSAIGVDTRTQTGYYLHNAPNEHLDTMKNLSSFNLPGGDYKFVAFNESKDEFIYTKIDSFPVDPKMSINELEISYKTYTISDMHANKSLPSWVDYNPYSKFIAPNVSTVVYDTIPTHQVHANENRTVKFKLHPVTQSIDIYFDVNKIIIDSIGGIHKFRVDSIYGEMSGIPFILNVSSGYIDIRRTCKVMFRCHMIDAKGNVITDNDNNTAQLHYKGTISVPTIVKNMSPTIITGPGIMQVIISCSTANPDYPVNSTKERVHKTFQGIINLYHSLDSAHCYDLTRDRQHAIQNGFHKELRIVKPLEVDGLKVLEENEEAGGLDVWKSTKKDTIIVHI